MLRPDGVYLLNVIDCPPLRVSRAEAATLLAAFDAGGAGRRPGPAARAGRRQRGLRGRRAVPLPLAGLRPAGGPRGYPDDVLDRAAVIRFAGSAPVATDATVDRWARLAPPPDLPVPLYGE